MESHSGLEEDWRSDLDLSSRGHHLLRSGLWADVQFAVGEKEDVEKAHRLVLASASPVFAAMLYGPLAEEKSPIRIPDVTLEIFNLLLEFIYTDMIEEVTVEKLPELEDVSKKYLVPHLMEACAKTLTKNVTPKNTIQCYEFATAIEHQPLIDACAKVFSFYPIQVFASESALDAKIETLECILSQDYLSINSEFDLLTIVEKYAKAKKNKIEGDIYNRSIRRLLQKIRFLGSDARILAKQHQRLRAFLTESELLSIMINCNCEDAAPMPEGFTTNRICRKIVTVSFEVLILSMELVNTLFRKDRRRGLPVILTPDNETKFENEFSKSIHIHTEILKSKVPCIGSIPGEVGVGRVFIFVGIVDEDAERFIINLQDEESMRDEEADGDGNIMLHLSVQFDEQQDDGGVVVRNTYQEASGWGPEEREGEMPFETGERFELTIEIEKDRFKICVDGDFFCYYAHRLQFEQIRYFGVKGDVEYVRFNTRLKAQQQRRGRKVRNSSNPGKCQSLWMIFRGKRFLGNIWRFSLFVPVFSIISFFLLKYVYYFLSNVSNSSF